MKNIILIALIAVCGLFIQVQTNYAQTAGEFIERAQAAESRGDYTEMVKNANEAVKLDPGSVDAYFLRGVANFALNKNAEALADADKALALNPKVATIYYLHSSVLLDLRPADWKIALADLDKAIEIDPTYWKYFRERARNRNLYARDFTGAFADADYSIKINASDASAFYVRGCANQELKKWADAESDYTQAIKLGENSEPLYTHRGIVDLHLGKDNADQARRDQAVDDFRKALEFAPNDKQLKENLEFAISKRAATKPSDPTPAPASSNSAAIMLTFYNLDNKTYDIAMPKAEKMFNKLKTHRYPAPQIIVVDPHCNYCLVTKTEVNPYKNDQKEFAQNLLRALGAMRAILNNSDAKELTAEQRQYSQDRLVKALALENEAGAWFAKH